MNEFGQFIPLIIIISIVWFLFARKKAKNLGQPKKVEEQSPTLRKNTSSILAQNAKDTGVKIYWNHTVVDTKGYRRIKSIQIMNE